MNDTEFMRQHHFGLALDKQTIREPEWMSALPPEADIRVTHRHVCGQYLTSAEGVDVLNPFRDQS